MSGNILGGYRGEGPATLQIRKSKTTIIIEKGERRRHPRLHGSPVSLSNKQNPKNVRCKGEVPIPPPCPTSTISPNCPGNRASTATLARYSFARKAEFCREGHPLPTASDANPRSTSTGISGSSSSSSSVSEGFVGPWYPSSTSLMYEPLASWRGRSQG